MNSKIEQLAEQAGGEHTQDLGTHQFYFYDDDLEKFAELIIREAYSIFENYEVYSGSYIGFAIQDHFGLE